MRLASLRSVRSVLFVSGFCLAYGCGGDDDSGSGARVKSGLPSQKSASELTPSEGVRLCESYTDAALKTITGRDFCTFMGVVEALTLSSGGTPQVDRALCEQARDECLAEGNPFEGEVEADCDTESISEDLADCNATVGEVEACFTAQLSLLASIFRNVSCSRTPTQEDFESFDPDARPAECQGLEQRCPGLFGGGFSDGPVDEPSPTGCDNTCLFANDGECDDGGSGSITNACGLGTDCNDCGERPAP